jgi:hypothetical protein
VRRRPAWLCALGLGLAGCASAGRLALPSGTGSPAADAAGPLDAATSACRGVTTLTAEASLGGRIGDRKARGRLLLGVEAGGRLRIEAVAPFGAPAFVLVSDGADATLLLPREDRVVAGVPVEDMLDALAGLRFTALDLHAALSGCGAPPGQPSGARRHEGGWLAVGLVGQDATVWIRELPSGPIVAAARLGDVIVEYGSRRAGVPERIRLVAPSVAGRGSVDLMLRLAQVETNVALPADAFAIRTPADVRPMTLSELRQVGLLN